MRALLLAGTITLAMTCAAQQTADAGQPKNLALTTKLTRVVVFKEGFGFYVREGQTKLERGWTTTNLTPAAVQALVERRRNVPFTPQQLAEFLEAISAPIEVRMLLAHPLRQRVLGGSVVGFEAVRFEHVAQKRDGLFGLGAGFLRHGPALHADHVAALAAGDLDEIGLLELLDEVGE